MDYARRGRQDHSDRVLGWLDRALLVGAWVCLLALATHRLFAYDIWWQIRAGEWIAAHGTPVIDPFSYAFPGQTWIEPRWLWCLLVHGIFGTWGANLLILAKLVLLSSVFGLLYSAGRRWGLWTVLIGMTIVLVAAHDRFVVRPELLSFVALTWTLFCVQRYKSGAAPLWIYTLPLLQIAWSNAHTLWILGPVTLWIIVAGELLEARLPVPDAWRRDDGIHGSRLVRLTAVAAATSLAALINPYGLAGLLFPFRLFHEISSLHPLSQTISEFRSPLSEHFLAWNFRSLGYLAVIGVSAFGFWLNRSRLSLARVALWAAFLFLSVQAQRNVALFGIVAGYVTMLNLGEARPAGRHIVPAVMRAAVALFLVLMIPLVVTDRFYRSQGSLKRFGFGVSDHRFPVRALSFVRENGLPLPVLHALGDGGYVLFDGGERSAYIDGRLEVYGSRILDRAVRTTWIGADLEQEAERTGVYTLLVRNELDYRPLLRHLEQTPAWVPVYFDHLHLVYLRVAPATRELVQRYGFSWDDPVRRVVLRPARVDPRDWLAGFGPRLPDAFVDERLGSLFAGVGNYALALEHFEAAHAIDPGNARVRLFLGLFYEAQGREADAARMLDGVPRGFLRDPSVHLLAAQIELSVSRPARAVDHLRRAIELGAPEPETSLRLIRAALLAGQNDLAVEELDRVAAAHADVADVWNLRAVVAMHQGRLRAAAEHFESSLRVDPDQPEVYGRLGELYTELGDLERATRMFDRAREGE